MSEFQPGEELEITLVARFAEYVADGAAIVVNHEYRTNADTSTTYVSETSLRLGHNLSIKRVAPPEWPPQPGDLWRDCDGDPWFAVLDDEDSILELVCSVGGGSYSPEYVAEQHSPMALVHREAGE